MDWTQIITIYKGPLHIINNYNSTCVSNTRLCIRSCLLREQTASQLVAIATRSDTGSHNRLDLIHSLVPPHYVCNGYISAHQLYKYARSYECISFDCLCLQQLRADDIP